MLDFQQLAAVAPEIDEDSSRFWQALAGGVLEVPRCNACARLSFPPMPACPRCGSPDVGPVGVSGRARVYSWVTVHAALDPDFADEVPYTIVTAELEEDSGTRVVGRLHGDSVDPLEAGARLRFAPYRVSADIVLPGFVLDAHPAEGASA